ncbi:MAG: YegP family protein [Luteimonas sp.]
MAAAFEVSRRSNGEFQFNLKAGNGQVILSSEGYSAKASCLEGIESVRKNSQDDARFERQTSGNGQPFFNLTASNGQVIGSSEMYADEGGRDNGIASVKSNAPGAAVNDQTG